VCAVLGVVISHGGWAIASTEVVIASFPPCDTDEA
jgi:hypothetical protein